MHRLKERETHVISYFPLFQLPLQGNTSSAIQTQLHPLIVRATQLPVRSTKFCAENEGNKHPK